MASLSQSSVPIEKDRDTAAQARIIKHMNADHSRSLSLYLQHYANLSPSAASSPTLSEISFTSLTISSRNGATYNIPIAPPLASWSDARSRVVAMDAEARVALGIDAITVDTYELPNKPLHFLVLALLVVYSTSYAARKLGVLAAGNLVFEVFLRKFPGGPAWFFWLEDQLLVPVLALHIAEAVWFERTRMWRYGIGRGSGLWWKWVGNTLVEGFGSIQRFDGIVARKRKELEKRKH